MYDFQSKPLLPFSRYCSVMLIGQITHLFRRFPMKSCSPIRAKTLRQKTVRIITSDSFLTDWIKAPTMVFRPVGTNTHNREWEHKQENSHSPVYWHAVSHLCLLLLKCSPWVTFYEFHRNNLVLLIICAAFPCDSFWDSTELDHFYHLIELLH